MAYPGQVVRFEAFFASAATGLGVSGLTVTVAVNTGTTPRVTVVSATAASVLDATNQPGWYYYDYTVPDAYYGTLEATFTTTDTSVVQRSGVSQYLSSLFEELGSQTNRDANVVNWKGGAVLTPDVTGVPITAVKYIIGTILTEGATGRLAAAFIKLLNVASPTGTVNSLPDAVPGANGGVPVLDSNLRISAKLTEWGAGIVQAFFDTVVTFAAAGSVGKLWNDLLDAINTVTAKFHFTGSSGSEKVDSQVRGMDTDVLDANALKADAIAEIQAGLATTAEVAAVQTSVNALPLLADIIDGVWDELLAGHTTPLSAAQYLIDAGSGGTPPTVTEIVNGILNELLATHTTAGSVAVAIALINSIYTLLLGASSIEVNDDFDSEGNLHLTKYQTYSAANGNRPTLTVSVTTDPSAATARWTLLQNGEATPITAELITYNSMTALATYGLSMTSAQTGALTAKAGGRDTGSFSLSIFLGGVNVLVPVPYPNGKLIVSDAPAPP